MLIESAPASANAFTWCSGRSIIRCTSSQPPASCTCSLSASTICGPIVIGGTKCPSITSTWITRAPASITVFTCSHMRDQSAARIDGATRRPSGRTLPIATRAPRAWRGYGSQTGCARGGARCRGPRESSPTPLRDAPSRSAHAARAPPRGEHAVALEIAEGAVVANHLEAVAQRLEATPRPVAPVLALSHEFAQQRGALVRGQYPHRASHLVLGHSGGLEQKRRQQVVL